MTPSQLESFLATLCANGFSNMREVPGHGFCALQRFVYTWGLCTDLSCDSYQRRYCYEKYEDSLAALLAWQGDTNHPAGPWIKCKGAGIDMLNPQLDWSMSSAS